MYPERSPRAAWDFADSKRLGGGIEALSGEHFWDSLSDRVHKELEVLLISAADKMRQAIPGVQIFGKIRQSGLKRSELLCDLDRGPML